MRRLPVLVLSSLLGACAAKQYVDPTGDLGGYSRITIENASTVGLGNRLYDDPLTCTGEVFLSVPALPLPWGESKAFYARKGEPATVGAWYALQGAGTFTRCDLFTTFIPTAGAYHLAFELDERARACSVVVVEGESRSGRALPRERIVVRKFNLPVRQGGPWCQALSDEQRATLGLAAPPSERPAAKAE